MNKLFLFKGLKYLGCGISLCFMSPIILMQAFQNREHSFYYPVLIIGIVLFFLAIYVWYLGIKNVITGFVEDK